MSRTSRGLTMGLAAMLALHVMAGAGQAQSIDLVPESSLVIVHVNSIGTFSDKVAALSKQLGLADISPEAADPIGSLLRQGHVQQGLDKGGDATLAYVDPKAAGVDDPSKSLLALVPITDFKAFVSNWPDAKDVDGAFEVQLGDNPQPSYLADWGKYAAISPDKSIAIKKGAGMKIAGLAAKEVAGKDVVLYANLPLLKADLLPKLEEERPRILERVQHELDRAVSGPPDDGTATPGPDAAKKAQLAKKFGPVVKAAVNQGLNVVQAFLRDGTGATIGISLNEKAINTTVLAEFEPTSYLGTTVMSVKNAGTPLVAGLPDGKYLFFGGASLTPEVATKVLDDLVSPIIQALPADDADAAEATKLTAAVKSFVGALKSQSFGLLAPTGQLGQEALLQEVTVLNGDGKALQASQRELLTAEQKYLDEFASPAVAGTDDANAAGGRRLPTIAFTQGAKTVDGIAFDELRTQLNLNANDPQQAQAAQATALLYGPNGMTAYSGLVDDQHLLVVSGGGDALLSSSIAAAKSNATALGTSDAVKQTDAQLPTQRVAAAYVPLDVILATGLSYAKQFGLPINVEIPENLPPIGATAATDGSAIRLDSSTPVALIQAIASAGIQTFMNLRGGGGN